MNKKLSLYPKISVLVTVKNREKSIERCLKSIIEQDYSNLEFVLIDGGSTDKTCSIIERYRKNISYFISEQDSGIYNALNKGLKKCTGDWILIIGSDDFLIDKMTLSHCAPFLVSAQKTQTWLAYGQTKMFKESETGEILWHETRGEPWISIKNKFQTSMTLPHPSSFQHISLFKNLGYFDETFKIAADFNFFLKILKIHTPLFIPKVIAAASLGGVSSKAEHSFVLIQEMMRARKQNNLFPFIPQYLYILIKLHTKKVLSKFIPNSTP